MNDNNLRRYKFLKKKILILILIRRRQRQKKRKKAMWMRKLFSERPEKGLFNVLVKDLQLHDAEYFFKSFRMTPQTFELLLSWVGPKIMKSSMRRVVATPEERLAVTRFVILSLVILK